MATYIMFLMQDGTPVRQLELEHNDDLDALDGARDLCGDHGVEVWQDGRLVASRKTTRPRPERGGRQVRLIRIAQKEKGTAVPYRGPSAGVHAMQRLQSTVRVTGGRYGPTNGAVSRICMHPAVHSTNPNIRSLITVGR
jgi:hypothetical protein